MFIQLGNVIQTVNYKTGSDTRQVGPKVAPAHQLGISDQTKWGVLWKCILPGESLEWVSPVR